VKIGGFVEKEIHYHLGSSQQRAVRHSINDAAQQSQNEPEPIGMHKRPQPAQECNHRSKRLWSRLHPNASTFLVVAEFGGARESMNRASVAAVVKRRRSPLREGSANSHWRLQGFMIHEQFQKEQQAAGESAHATRV
jgi:hypothetical protein